MLTLDQIKERLKHANLLKVSESAGIHSNTIYKLMKGGKSPSYDTVKKLSDYFEGVETRGA